VGGGVSRSSATSRQGNKGAANVRQFTGDRESPGKLPRPSKENKERGVGGFPRAVRRCGKPKGSACHACENQERNRNQARVGGGGTVYPLLMNFLHKEGPEEEKISVDQRAG